MHVDKTGIFRTSLNSISQMIADTLNRYAIPRLFAINGWKPSELPKITPSDVDAPDLNQLATFMSAMSGTGITWFPDGDLENFIRDVARLPKLDDDELELRRQMQLRDQATQFAEANATYVQSLQTEQAARMGQLPLPGMGHMGSEQEGAQSRKGKRSGGDDDE
jgi:hypothetical protein